MTRMRLRTKAWFGDEELTIDFPCTHFSPASSTDHFELSIMIGSRAISGSVAM